jgi:hypothetical protein
VLLLLFVIIAQFADKINIFSWQWLESLAAFANDNSNWILLFDRIVISFFVADLYFSFFKKAKTWTFIRHSFLDIIAVFPFGLFIRAETLAVQEAQEAVHLLGEAEKEASKLSRMARIEAAAVRFLARSARFIRPAAKFTRMLRIYRLIDFFKSKKKHKHKKRK